jgi:hypothetical protein
MNGLENLRKDDVTQRITSAVCDVADFASVALAVSIIMIMLFQRSSLAFSRLNYFFAEPLPCLRAGPSQIVTSGATTRQRFF